jgi:hypothetical protein
MAHHLSPEDIVELAEGARDDSTSAHLLQCPQCRRQLADTRATMGAVHEVDVPEPSPLFWNHLSARVREAVAREAAVPRPGRWAPIQRWWIRAAVVAAFGAVAVVGITSWRPGGAPAAVPARAGLDPVPAGGGAAPGASGDPSFDLVADFGGTLDWDDLRDQMGESVRPGGLDATVGELNGGERQELERLLKEELMRRATPPGRS